MASEQTTDLGAHGVVTADYFLVYIERGGEVFAIDNSGHHYRNFEHAEAQAERTNDQIRNGTTGWPIDDITGDEQAYVVTADGTVV